MSRVVKSTALICPTTCVARRAMPFSRNRLPVSGAPARVGRGRPPASARATRAISTCTGPSPRSARPATRATAGSSRLAAASADQPIISPSLEARGERVMASSAMASRRLDLPAALSPVSRVSPGVSDSRSRS